MQQQLAKLQVALEQTHADFNGLGEGRARAELDADAAKRRYSELKDVGDALSKRLIKNEAELNSLQDTLRQVPYFGQNFLPPKNDELDPSTKSRRRPFGAGRRETRWQLIFRGSQKSYASGNSTFCTLLFGSISSGGGVCVAVCT